LKFYRINQDYARRLFLTLEGAFFTKVALIETLAVDLAPIKLFRALDAIEAPMWSTKVLY
jgi:hypothetical protein